MHKFIFALILLFSITTQASTQLDNLFINGNTISTVDTNGDLILDLNGSGKLQLPDLSASTVPYLDSNKKLTSSAATPTQLGYLANATSNLCGISQACTFTSKTLTSPVINSPTGIVKGDVGLGNVDNTSDATKNSATATLSGKTLTAPIIDIINATEQSSTPSTPSSGTKKIYCKSDGFCYTKDSAGNEVKLGAGGAGGLIGDREYITNTDFESGGSVATGWNAYADAAGVQPVDGTGGSPVSTCTRTTLTPITKTGSMLWTKAGSANRQGEGCSADMGVDQADLNHDMQIEFDYRVGTGTFTPGTVGSSPTDSDIEVFLYDITNAKLVAVSDFKLYVSSTSLSTHFSQVFHMPATAGNVRLIFHTATTTTNNFTLEFDNVSVHPYTSLSVSNMSDRIDAGANTIGATTTPPTKGGTITVDSVSYTRLGDSARIVGRYQQTAGGSAGSGDYLFALPGGLTFGAGVTYYTGVIGAGIWIFPNSLGSAAFSDNTGNATGVVVPYDSTHFRLAGTSSASGSSGHGIYGSNYISGLGATNAAFSYDFTTTIAGFTSTSAGVRADQSNYPPTAYTPTITGLGTVTNVSLFQERKGSWLHVYGTFTSGTAAASLFSVTLPSGLSIDTTKVINNTTSNPGQSVGRYIDNTSTGAEFPIVTATATNAGVVYLGAALSGSSKLTPQNGNIANSSAAVSIDFKVPIATWTENQSVPLLVGTVFSGTGGQERIERAKITGSATTPTVASQSGSWISSVTRNSQGNYTINIPAGMFSSAPSCTGRCVIASGLAIFQTTTANTTTAVTAICTNTTQGLDQDMEVICMGPR